MVTANSLSRDRLSAAPSMILLVVCLWGFSSVADETSGGSVGIQAQATRRALLIGCSQYPYESASVVAPLPGAENDVRRFAELLQGPLEFQDLTVLTGWPLDESHRPTAARICAAFESLIERASAGDQILILLSGHGSQMAIDPTQTDLLDAANPEPDGMDEVFLASDYSRGANAIRDNQFGIWLDRLRNRGCHVWIIFDCCHSGSMTRGSTDPSEVRQWTRGVNAQQLDLDPAVIQGELDRSRALRDGQGTRWKAGAVPITAGGDAGSVVAFYACQPFELATEVIRPTGASNEPGNRCGLLSYQILKGLRQAGTSQSYRDLTKNIIAGLRAEFGSRGPTPMFEGALDRPVLEISGDWPAGSPLYLERRADGYRVSGGELAGLTPQTILSVHAIGGQTDEAIGFLRVINTTLAEADVESVAQGGQPEIPLERFPVPARCKIVSQEWTAPELLISVEPMDLDLELDLRDSLPQVWKSLKSETSKMVHWSDDPANASWGIVALSRQSLTKRFHLNFGPAIVLYERRDTQTPASDDSANGNQSRREVVLATYLLRDDPRPVRVGLVAERIASDIQKISTCQNLWRIAHAYGQNSPLVEKHEVTLDVSLVEDRKISGGNISVERSLFRPGDRLEVKLNNVGFDPMWYSVFFMNGNYGIEHVRSGTIPGRPIGPASKPLQHAIERMEISPSSTGVEGYLVLAIPLKGNRAEPDFRFLSQSGVGESVTRKSLSLPDHPSLFEVAMLQAISGQKTLRSGLSPEAPCVTSYSWITVTD